jgi:hypothetical protein
MSRKHFGQRRNGGSVLSNEEIKRLALELIESLGDDVSKIKLGRIGKFDPLAIHEAYALISESVKRVEIFADTYDGMAGEDKRKVVAEVLNDLIDIPWCPEFVEQALFEWSIDLVVYLYNKIGGQAWLNQLFGSDE